MSGVGKTGSGRGGGHYRNPCLTMHQPWASLLIHGIKRIEGRSWPSPLTGRLWIHAASKVPEPETIKQMEKFYREIYAVDGVTDIKFPEHYPVSRLLGCVEIVGCLKKEEVEHWEEVPRSVRFEGLTEFCWLCEKPQKLIVPFEMRGYQGVYNLENKIYEAAVRGLTAIKGPLPVKFPLPDPQNSLSLKPGSLLLSNTKASEVEKSASVSAAIAGARAAAAQFSRKDESISAIKEQKHETTMNQTTVVATRFTRKDESKSAIKEQKHETTKNHATVDADRPNKTAYNLRKRRDQEENQGLSSERKLTSAGSRDTISKQSETRILAPHGSTKVLPSAKKFRFAGFDPELEEKLDRMFTGVVATGEHVWAPIMGTTREKSPVIDVNEEGINESNDESEGSHCKRTQSRPPPSKRMKKAGDAFLRDQIAQLVTTCSNWASTSEAATARTTITDVIRVLDGIPEVCNDMEFYVSCIGVLEDPVKREAFMALLLERRVPYLRYCCGKRVL